MTVLLDRAAALVALLFLSFTSIRCTSVSHSHNLDSRWVCGERSRLMRALQPRCNHGATAVA